jgi:hypothetical protein
MELLDVIVTELELAIRENNYEHHWAKRAGLQAPPRLFLSSYSVISRKLQYAIERKTFRKLQTNTSEFGELYSMVRQNHHRCSVIRKLQLRIDLPESPTGGVATFETIENWNKNNVFFSKAIEYIWKAFNVWESFTSVLNLELELWISSPEDNSDRLCMPEVHRNFLSIEDYALIPPTRLISRLTIGMRLYGRDMDINSLVLLASKCYGLKEVSFNIRKSEDRFPMVYKAQRYGQYLWYHGTTY